MRNISQKDSGERCGLLFYLIYCFTSRSRNFHLYGDITVVGEGLQNLGLCSGRLIREGSLSCHTCCEGPLFLRSHLKDRLIQSPLTAHKGSNLDPHGAQAKTNIYAQKMDTYKHKKEQTLAVTG